MKKIIIGLIGISFLAGCAYSPRQSDRVETIKNGDTKEHLIAVAGWPDDVINVDKHTTEYKYTEKNWFNKNQKIQSVYVRDGKVYLIKYVVVKNKE